MPGYFRSLLRHTGITVRSSPNPVQPDRSHRISGVFREEHEEITVTGPQETPSIGTGLKEHVRGHWEPEPARESPAKEMLSGVAERPAISMETFSPKRQTGAVPVQKSPVEVPVTEENHPDIVPETVEENNPSGRFPGPVAGDAGITPKREKVEILTNRSTEKKSPATVPGRETGKSSPLIRVLWKQQEVSDTKPEHATLPEADRTEGAVLHEDEIIWVERAWTGREPGLNVSGPPLPDRTADDKDLSETGTGDSLPGFSEQVISHDVSFTPLSEKHGNSDPVSHAGTILPDFPQPRDRSGLQLPDEIYEIARHIEGVPTEREQPMHIDQLQGDRNFQLSIGTISVVIEESQDMMRPVPVVHIMESDERAEPVSRLGRHYLRLR